MNRLREKIENNAKLQASIVIVLGALAVLSVAYYKVAMKPSSGDLSWLFAESLGMIAIAFVGFGFFGLMLDAKNWRDYFSERLKQVVIENDYLGSLDEETLKSLQIRVLKAQFKNPLIDKDGSFLNYFHTHLHKFISEPYREDVSVEMIITEVDGNFSVLDKVNFICRSSGGRIQSNVKWKPDEGEFIKVSSIVIRAKESNTEKLIDLCIKNSAGDLSEALENGLDVDLSSYKEKDGLRIFIESIYTIDKSKFQYWQMAHPTKSSDIIIKYPDNLKMQFKALFIDDVDMIVTDQPGYLKIKYNSWLLPQSGIAWKIT